MLAPAAQNGGGHLFLPPAERVLVGLGGGDPTDHDLHEDFSIATFGGAHPRFLLRPSGLRRSDHVQVSQYPVGDDLGRAALFLAFLCANGAVRRHGIVRWIRGRGEERADRSG